MVCCYYKNFIFLEVIFSYGLYYGRRIRKFVVGRGLVVFYS